LRILWIEDNEDVQKAFASFFQKNGVSVCSAACGATGLRWLAREVFDAVLLDLDLPDMSGIAIAKQLRAKGNTTPVVVLTAYPAPTSAFEAGQLKLSFYLEKPIDPQKLYDRLQSAIVGSIGETTTRRHAFPPIAGHVRDRISALIVRGVLAEVDLPTTAKWGTHVGVAEGTLRGWCATAEISPKRALLFTRILRALNIHRTSGKPILESLEIADKRTIRKVLFLAGLAPSEGGVAAVSVNEFLATQRLVTDEAILASVARHL
jgi:CheY-like chemotaxis protein